MKIVEVRALTVDLPLPRPIVIGRLRFDSRDYVLVEVVTDDGLRGTGFGLARNAPVAAIVERNLRPLLLGEDPRQTEAIWDRLYYSNYVIGRHGIFMRALSAVDIALWDIKGQACGLPVWRMLGGARTQVPAQVAGGYPAAGRTLDDLGSEIAGYAAAGYHAAKIAAENLEADTARLAACRAAAPNLRLAIDVHWGWHSLTDVLPVVERWDGFGLEWIEDPFPSDQPWLIERLRSRIRTPLAIGEDLTGRWAFRSMFRLGITDVVRVDATTVGGITEAARVCAMASAEGLSVSPHIFPELHVHLGAAFGCVGAVETTDPGRHIDLFYQLLQQPITPEDGIFRAPEGPGLGIAIDWQIAERYRSPH